MNFAPLEMTLYFGELRALEEAIDILYLLGLAVIGQSTAFFLIDFSAEIF